MQGLEISHTLLIGKAKIDIKNSSNCAPIICNVPRDMMEIV